MSNKNEKMSNTIIQGWRAMLLILMTMTIIWMLTGAMYGKLQSFAQEQGNAGLWNWTIFFSTAAIIPFFIKRFKGKVFKWVIFVITFLWTLIFFTASPCLFNVIKWLLGIGKVSPPYHPAPGPYIPFLYLIHHIVAVWTTIIAFKWAKLNNEKNGG